MNSVKYMEDLKKLFDQYKTQILEVMPYCEVEHVGGSAISGINTKGDLDIQIRVAADNFKKAVTGSDSLFTRRYESLWNEDFALFADSKQSIKIDIMITVKGSAYDSFFQIRDAMIRDPLLRERYANLKKKYPDFLSDDYRKAKDIFFREIEAELGLKIRPLSTVMMIAIKDFEKEGFAHVYEWTDVPDTIYPEHAHKGKVAFYITKGSVTFAGEINATVNAGERFDVPIGVKHTAKVGPEGCTFVVGEEIEGDS